MTDEHDGEVIEVPAERWRWTYVPIALFGCGQSMATAVSELCENMVMALGMDLKYRRLRERERSEALGGPLYRG
ncbi:MAG TPA: hypothetical protein VFS39_18405 [Nitrospira sp.]|nr:hypothetical protein [Nitrospira sp.]